MEDVMTGEDLDSGRKKTVAVSLLALGALAAGGAGYRQRRQANSSEEWARKGAVLVLVLIAIAALVAIGARRRRARAEDVASTNGSPVVAEDGIEPIPTRPIASSG